MLDDGKNAALVFLLDFRRQKYFDHNFDGCHFCLNIDRPLSSTGMMLYICVNFWLMAHESRELSQVEQINFSQNDHV